MNQYIIVHINYAQIDELSDESFQCQGRLSSKFVSTNFVDEQWLKFEVGSIPITITLALNESSRSDQREFNDVTLSQCTRANDGMNVALIYNAQTTTVNSKSKVRLINITVLDYVVNERFIDSMTKARYQSELLWLQLWWVSTVSIICRLLWIKLKRKYSQR
jgi:hypothetical protein